jgi:23S rRNA pseudouridine955/2504/2580 synthase
VRHIDGMLPEGYRLVHRLDRDTTGVLVIAKHARAAAGAGKAFQSKRAEKTYWAVTNGVPKPAAGEIKGYLGKGKTDNSFGNHREGREIMMAVKHGAPGSKYARTLYHTEQKAGQRAAFVKMRPLTGRTHQLRMHAQLLGAPVAGDPKYLTDRPMPGGLEEKLHLHAHSLVLPRPDGALHLSAPLPVHMKTAFHMLGFSEITNDVDWDAL